MTDHRRHVPRTDALLADPRLADAAEAVGREALKRAVRETQDRIRSGELTPDAAIAATLSALSALPTAAEPSLTPVINATGVVVHTNLGRAPLSDAALRAVQVAGGYVDLEYDRATGLRGTRGAGVLAAALAAVPEAEAVHVVNNGAAALLLAATALAGGREIVLSRGEMIEIGAGFRLADILAAAGARVREVGSTNRTHLADYAAALGEQSGFLLKVHTSNFHMAGFVSSVSVGDLAGLAAGHPLPLVVDVGGGLLAPDPLLPDEPDVRSALAAGADLVTCSGDKLLGGPQAGLVFGRAEVVERLRRHPVSRALRVDKLGLAALEATLRGPETPVWHATHLTAEQLHERSARLAAATGGSLIASEGRVGGGVAADVGLPGWAVAYDDASLAERLRRGRPPVVGRTSRSRLLLDLRCVPPERDADVIEAVLACS